MSQVRGTGRRRISGAVLCLAALTGAEVARAGDGALAPDGIGGGIRIAYAMASPGPTIDSIRHLREQAKAARVAAVLRLTFDATPSPQPAPRPFHAWPAPEPGFARGLYAETGVRRPVQAIVADDDFIEGFDSGPGVRWDPAAAGGRFALVRPGGTDAGSGKLDVDEDPGERLADLIGVSSQIGENTKLKLRYSNSRKRMKGLSVVFAWDF